jgi:hypothetical protein
VDLLATILQVIGAISLVVAAFIVHIALGFAVLGVGAVLFGLALERGQNAK